MTWDGRERRTLTDRELLVRIDENVQSISKWKDTHDEKDDKRFSEIRRYLIWLAVCVVVVASSTGVLPQLLANVKIS